MDILLGFLVGAAIMGVGLFLGYHWGWTQGVNESDKIWKETWRNRG